MLAVGMHTDSMDDSPVANPSKGGRARAAKLTPEERSEISRQAAEARWGRSVQFATHVGELVIGNRALECAVLEDGTRVLSQGTILEALDREAKKGRQSEDRPPFLAATNLQPLVTPELRGLWEPIEYRDPRYRFHSVGYKAEILPMVCEVYLEARAHDVLLPSQRPAAQAAEVLVRGLARVGITALVDEATGYQEVRARDELRKILEAYVESQFRPWVRMFPADFFREIYRLQGWEYKPGTSKRTPYVGKLINHYIYEQLPNGVLDELRRVNPADAKGRRKRKHHQHLSETTGNPHLDRQIATVTTLMKIANDKTEFESLFERAFPPAQPKLPVVVDVPAATGEPDNTGDL